MDGNHPCLIPRRWLGVFLEENREDCGERGTQLVGTLIQQVWAEIIEADCPQSNLYQQQKLYQHLYHLHLCDNLLVLMFQILGRLSGAISFYLPGEKTDHHLVLASDPLLSIGQKPSRLVPYPMRRKLYGEGTENKFLVKKRLGDQPTGYDTYSHMNRRNGGHQQQGEVPAACQSLCREDEGG